MLLIAFGTRPEWIKLKPVIDKIHGKIPYKLLYIEQHKELIDNNIFDYQFDTLKIKPILLSNRLDNIIHSILNEILYHLTDNIKYTLIQGDTTTAFGIALASFHRQIPIIHLEAGLRTYDTNNPYPEEFNRQAISSMATIHLCPTESAKQNLINEGKTNNIYITGNTILDNLIDLPIQNKNYILVTLHRRENHKIMDQWFNVINDLANKNQKYKFIIPLHLNPNVQKHKNILTNITIIKPLNHQKCIDLIRTAAYIITDSGGIQEEAAFFKKRCIVCRKITERTEGIGTFSFLCNDPQNLHDIFKQVINLKDDITNIPCPYGDGHASDRILKILQEYIE